MANKVNQTPFISVPINLTSITAIGNYILGQVSSLLGTFQEHAATINALVDQTTPTTPVPLKSYLKTALPLAATYSNNIIIVSNDVGGLTIAYSDGTNWRRVQDRAIIA